MKSLTVLVCGNGLGHLRRVLAMLWYWHQNYRDSFPIVKLFAPLDKIEEIGNWPVLIALHKVKRLEFCQFDTDSFLNYLNWDQEFRNNDFLMEALLKSDYVWSDNLTEVLDYRDDAFFTGSFLWHEVVSSNSLYQEKMRCLLEKNNPVFIGNKYFATPEVKDLKNFIGVGLYRFNPKVNSLNRTDILLSCGLSGQCQMDISDGIDYLLSFNKDFSFKIWVEPSLFPVHSPKWLRKATFSAEMYEHIAAACTRPGMGTISDVLLNKGRLFCFSEPENYEMEHNTMCVKHLEVGCKCDNVVESLNGALDYLVRPELQELHLEKVNKIDDTGIQQSVEQIIRILE